MVTSIGLGQILVYLVVLLLLVKPLGLYMAQVYERKRFKLTHVSSGIERGLYRLCGVNPEQEMEWKTYLVAMLMFNLVGVLLVYLIQRLQGVLPFNPQAFPEPGALLAFNTAVSFVTNTNWQAYSGETTLSYLTQMLALTTQNFLSAATGMSLLVAFIRGLARREAQTLGNFWVDMVRSVFYILLPLSFILAIVLVSQGVVQTVLPSQRVSLMQSLSYSEVSRDLAGQSLGDVHYKPVPGVIQVTEQVIPRGPVASQVAIKQLGSNGGGFFNANGAHPFENPTPLTDFLEVLAILLIPAAFCYTFGVMAKDRRQGWALLITMMLVFVVMTWAAVAAEQRGNPAVLQLGVELAPKQAAYPGGNMEGKETRFGIVSSALWAVASTSSSNGSTNSAYDSYTPLGGLVPLWMMHLGEVIFGGVGTGLSGMLIFVMLTVFVAGLMVGRTPEYLGKKIGPYEMKMASIAVLVLPLSVLVSTAVASVTEVGTSVLLNPESHGFTEMLYAFTSLANNNGSAMGGLNSNTPFYTLLGSFVMLMGRYWVAIPTLAIAGALVQKRKSPGGVGSLATHSPLFVVLLISIILLLGALSFLPALALGSITEHLMLWGQYGR